MSRKNIESIWNRDNRNNINDNFIKLFESTNNFIENPAKYIKNKSLSLDQLNFVSSSKNMFNKFSIIKDTRISIGGRLVDAPGVVTANIVSIESGVTYYTNESIWIVTYNKNSEALGYKFVAKGNTFTTESDAKYITISTNERLINKVQVEKGTKPTPYAPYSQILKGVGISEVDEARQSVVLKKQYDSLNQRLDAIESIASSSGSSHDLLTDDEYKRIFVKQMNDKAKLLGMSRATWLNASGLTGVGQLTTTRDMLYLMKATLNYPTLIEMFGLKTKEIEVKGPEERKFSINTTVTDPDLEEDYIIIGGKTGTLGVVKNLSLIVKHRVTGRILVGNILKAENDRFAEMKSIFDSVINFQSTSVSPTAYSVMELEYGDNYLFRNDNPTLSVSKNLDTLVSPASLTKTLSAIVAIENCKNLNSVITFKESDLVEDVLKFNVGDKITVRDALFLMMLQSNNSAATALSRTVGQHIFESQGFV